jgi:glycopeptide antibiotics resistance protein
MVERSVYVLFAGVLVALTVIGLVRAARASTDRPRWVTASVLVWLAAFVFMTVRPGNGRGVRLNLVPFVVDGPGSAFDAVLNVIVFVPPGLLLAGLGWRLLAVLAAALAVTLSVEVVQYVTDWGRTADVNDLITNVSGAGLGWLVAWSIARGGSRAAAGTGSEDDPAEATSSAGATLER